MRRLIVVLLMAFLGCSIGATVRAEDLDGHLYGVVVIPTDVISGFAESTIAALERQTDLRFRQVHYGDFSHGLDLQTWAPDFLKDVEPGRAREFARLLATKPRFLLQLGKGKEPAWLSQGIASYTQAGGVVITEAMLAGLPKANGDSLSQDDTHQWARAVEELVRTACKQPLPGVKVTYELPVNPADKKKATDIVPAGQPIPVTLAPIAGFAGKVNVLLEDRSGVACLTVPAQLTAGQTARVVLQPAADFVAGSYHLVARRSQDGRELGCTYITVTQPLTLALADDGKRHGQSETAVTTATISLPDGAADPGNLTLKWVVRDYRRGVIAYREEPITVTSGQSLTRECPLTLDDQDAKAWVYWVQANVEKNGKLLAQAETHVYRWRPFSMREQLLFGTWHVASGNRPTALRPLITEYLESFGLRAALSEGDEVFQRAGFRASIEHGAMTVVNFREANKDDRTAGWKAGGKGYWAKAMNSPAYAIWSLGEETGYEGNWSEAYPWRDQPEAPENAQYWFREYLKTRYPTIEALNTSWGTAFTDWSEAKYQRKYAYPYGWLFVAPAESVEKNLAPYVDTHGFQEWWVHEVVTNNVAGLHEANPVPRWTKSFEFTFIDWCQTPMTHFCASTDPHGTALWNAYARVKTPDAPPAYHLNWGFYDDPRQTDQFWKLGVISGATYLDNWGETMNWDLTHTRASMRVRDLAAQLKPAANLLLQAYPVDDMRVGIFLEDTPWKLSHGRPGYFLKGRAPHAQTYGPTTQSPPGASWLESAEGPLYAALTSAGYAPRFITRDEIPNAKIIFLPYTEALSRESAQRLTAFVNAGGLLIALPRLAEYDEGGHPYDVLPGAGMRELFGLTVADNWVGRESMVPLPGMEDAKKIFADLFQPGVKLTPAQEAEILSFDLSSSYGGQPLRLVSQAHQAVAAVADGTKVLCRHEDDVPALTYRGGGKGAAIFLNIFRGWPNTLHIPEDENDVAYAKVLRVLAEYAGVTPSDWFETLDSNGQYAPQLALFRYTGPRGIMRLVGYYNDWRSADAETRFIINTPVKAVYDVFTGEWLPLREHLGHPCAFVSAPRGSGRLLALLPYEVTAVTVTASARQVTAGEAFTVTPAISVSEGQPETHPAHLTVYAPDGKEIPDADREVLIDGKPIRIPTYLDLPAGDYRVEVRDCATRMAGACTVRVTANPARAKLPAAAPFGWPSWQQRTIAVGPAELERSLDDLSALYATEDPDPAVAYSFYVMERDRSRHRLGQLLANADWTANLPVLQRMLAAGKRLVLTGEDLGIDPGSGAPAVPLTTPTQLAALARLAATKGAKLFLVRGLPDVLLIQVGKGMIVLDRRSLDREAGTGPTRLTAWMHRWHEEMQSAGLLPGGAPTQSRLIPLPAGMELTGWFLERRTE